MSWRCAPACPGCAPRWMPPGRAGHDRQIREGSDDGYEGETDRCPGSGVCAAAWARGDAMGCDGARLRAAGTSRREPNVDRAPPPGGQLAQAHAGAGRRALGRRGSECRADAHRGRVLGRLDPNACADRAGVRPGVPCRLCLPVEAGYAGGAREQSPETTSCQRSGGGAWMR